jgi:hypothetical protein
MVSIVVVTVGLVTLLSVFSFAIASAQTSQDAMIAKQLATSAMESIFTARETAEISWKQIQNATATGDGIFVSGFQAVKGDGTDGIIGTRDDTSTTSDALRQAGPDGIVGTADDINPGLTRFQRQILIEDVPNSTSLRRITITVQYTMTQTKTTRSYVLSGFISQYR